MLQMISTAQALVLGLLVFVFCTLVQHLASPLRSVPGPFLARWTDVWYLWHVARGDFQVTNQQLHDTYGPVVRYGPNRYSFNDCDAATAIYGRKAQFAKSPWYTVWRRPGTWSLFSDESISRHGNNRKLYQNAYSMTSLVSYEGFVDQCSDVFAKRLSEKSSANISFNMQAWFLYYAFDVMGFMTYGKTFGFLDQGRDVGGVIYALNDHLWYGVRVGIYSYLHPILYRIRNFMVGKSGSGGAYLINFTEKCIADTAAGKIASADSELTRTIFDSSGSEPFLSKFLAKHRMDPDTFTPFHILAGCTSNMIAGSDTTAVSLSAILYNLLQRPECLRRLQEEIEDFTDKNMLSPRPSFKESLAMPYLQAVIKEALRVHPPTGLPLERIVPQEGCCIGDYHFPEGTTVGINTWVQHHNKDVYGEDVGEFKPERWLTEDAERLRLMNRHWIPFGLGSRTCLGRHVSMLEMGKLIPRIIRDFEFRFDDNYLQGQYSWKILNTWFVKPTEFTVKVARRW